MLAAAKNALNSLVRLYDFVNCRGQVNLAAPIFVVSAAGFALRALIALTTVLATKT